MEPAARRGPENWKDIILDHGCRWGLGVLTESGPQNPISHTSSIGTPAAAGEEHPPKSSQSSPLPAGAFLLIKKKETKRNTNQFRHPRADATRCAVNIFVASILGLELQEGLRAPLAQRLQFDSVRPLKQPPQTPPGCPVEGSGLPLKTPGATGGRVCSVGVTELLELRVGSKGHPLWCWSIGIPESRYLRRAQYLQGTSETNSSHTNTKMTGRRT